MCYRHAGPNLTSQAPAERPLADEPPPVFRLSCPEEGSSVLKEDLSNQGLTLGPEQPFLLILKGPA